MQVSAQRRGAATKDEVAMISAQQWVAVAQDEVAIRVHGVFPLPMGMEREDRCD